MGKNRFFAILLIIAEAALGIAVSKYFILPEMTENTIWKARVYAQAQNDAENRSISEAKAETELFGDDADPADDARPQEESETSGDDAGSADAAQPQEEPETSGDDADPADAAKPQEESETSGSDGTPADAAEGSVTSESVGTEEEAQTSEAARTQADADIPELDIESIAAQQAALANDQEEVTASVSMAEQSIPVAPNSVNIIGNEESSHYVQTGHKNTSAQLIDGDTDTSWQVDGSGINSWVRYSFDKEYSIGRIVFWLGVWRDVEGKDYYHGNYRPKKILIEAAGKQWEVSFEDIKWAQQVSFSAPIMASDIKFTILDYYMNGDANGNRYEQTGIAEIGIYAI